ncbi:MAG: serine peptidase, partial [Gammaproteobacteria bacterium]
SRSGGYQGLSFSIPINVAMSIAEQLKEQGYATRGWLGVAIQNVDQALAQTFGLERPHGALVASVSDGGPADKGGIEQGDVILEFNGRPVPTSSSLPPLVGAVAPGEEVEVTVMRGGKERTLEVTIDALDVEHRQAGAGGSPGSSSAPLGLSIRPLDNEELADLGVESGVLVAGVEPGSPAEMAGFRQGDILLSIDNVAIGSADDIAELVEKVPAGKPVAVLVQRGSSSLFFAMNMPRE